MAKLNINIGTADKGDGDPLRVAFSKVNDNFTELYTALGLDVAPLNLGAFEFTGSVMSTTDSSAITIDQATTITSNLTVGGDILPSTNLGGNLGSPTQMWKSLYVSNNTIYINNVPLRINASLTVTDAGELYVDGQLFSGGGGSISDFGEGFTDSLDSGKITTSKLYNENPNPGLNNQYELGVTNGGVVTLPDGSIINGATLKTIAGNYAGITAGPASPAGKDEDSWMWVDNNGATIATKYSTDAHTWTFNNSGALTFPQGTTIATADGTDAFIIDGAVDKDIQIYTYSGPTPTAHGWTFGTDGDLTLPAGGDILDSEGNSVLGGATGDANVWVQTFETQTGAPTDIVSIAISVEYDSAGNVIALFNHFNDEGGGSYYSVGKYTTTGAKIWTARFDDEFYTDGWGLAVDNDTDSIYVAGETDVEGQDNATLTKLDSTDGSVLWSKIYDFGFSSQSSVVDVASDGNPVMVGYAYNGTDDYVATTKVDEADGSVIWSRALDGQADEEAYGMAVGPTGEVVAIGYMEQLGVSDGVATLYADNNLNWTGGVLGATSNGVAFSVTVTAGVATFSNISDTIGNRSVDDVIATINGSVFGGVDGVDDMVVKVGTLATNDPDNRMLVVKYASDGTIAWQKAILFDAGFDCRGADADIDSMGNIYVTGSYQYSFDGGTTNALSILKLDGTGAKQWSRRVTGDCDTFGVSVVVGADDKLYLSAMTGNNNDANNAYTWVAAKYDFNGQVEWQRLIDKTTTGWTFTGGIFFSDGGGSNIAVKSGYVVLGGGFGDFIGGGTPQATLIQVAASGDVFSVSDWDFKAASFSGVLNGTASDITVVDAGKTDTDNSENITTGTVTLTTEVSGFLLGTLYSTTANNRLFNGGNELVLGTTGTVTLPQGGTITEGYVTSNPTIQLTPATPAVASQKLVIKGGGTFSNTENGITVTVPSNTWTEGNVDYVYVDAPTRGGQTLYWWIYPEDAGLSTPSTGTVVLDEFGEGNFTFTLTSDAYEFRVRVSPEEDNYDPANVGVQSVLINSGSPTFEGEHHLHLTTGDLAVTSIFLGTDDQNVRTTTNGNIEITTPNATNKVWEFDTDGNLTIPGDIKSEGNIDIEINLSDSTQRRWTFGEDGNLNIPGDIVNSTGVSQTARRVEGSWTVTTGTNTYNFTVPSDGTYTLWVKGNIPNGIITWNATLSITNTNVPAIGYQYAWNYTGGGSPILLTAIPDQIRGTAGAISTDATYVGSTSNRFDFTIANTSGASVTVYYGYTKV